MTDIEQKRLVEGILMGAFAFLIGLAFVMALMTAQEQPDPKLADAIDKSERDYLVAWCNSHGGTSQLNGRLTFTGCAIPAPAQVVAGK